MNEQAKIILYTELLNFEKIANSDDIKVIEWEKFEELEPKEAFKYVISFRDDCMKKANADKDLFYIEFPPIDLNGEDLKDVYLHTFIPGLKRVRNTGKEIFVSTKINLKDTNCTINIATIKPTISSEDGKERKANIKNCDFRGCKVFGKFQNDNYYIEYESKNLPEEYMSRIKQNNYPDALKNLASSLYLEMLEGRTPKKVKDIKKLRQIVDFDLTSLKKNIWKYRNLIKETKLNI